MPTFIAKCTPSLGRVSIWWARMSESLLWPMGIGKIMLYTQDKVGGEIAEARNSLVENAREYDRTCNPVSHIFWHDDDVLAFPGSVIELLAQGKDIVTGTYFLKLPGNAAQPLVWPGTVTKDVAPLGEFPTPAMIPFIPDRVVPCVYHGMGLTLVKLSVYDRMEKELDLPKDKYGRTQFYKTATEKDYFQDAKGCTHMGFTEDVFFLRNAARIGIQPWAVTTKHAFGFHTSANWQCDCGFSCNDPVVSDRHRRAFPEHKGCEGLVGYPEEQWRQWIGDGNIVWKTPDGDVAWD